MSVIPSKKVKDKEALQWTQKYRPRYLHEYVGNDVVKYSLMRMMGKNELPQTIMFEGPPGTGKTSFARLLSKEIACTNRTDEGSSCGECISCKSIEDNLILSGDNAGARSIVEINMTTQGGVDAVKQLVADMRTKPLSGQKKVYILDEVQKITEEGQNVLLKISEEPYEWLYIFLCTTEPDKIIAPLKSRFRVVKIRKPKIADIKERLKIICEREGVRYQDSALHLIANVSGKTPRDSIKNLELVARNGDVTFKLASSILQVVSSEIYIEFIRQLKSHDIADILAFIDKIEEDYEVDFTDFIQGLAQFVMDAFNITMQVGLDKYTEDMYKTIKIAFKTYDTEAVIKLLSLIEEAIKLKWNPRYAIMMMSLKFSYPEYFEKGMPEGKKGAERELEKENDRSVEAYRDMNHRIDEDMLHKFGEGSKVGSESNTVAMLQSVFGASRVVQLDENKLLDEEPNKNDREESESEK